MNRCLKKIKPFKYYVLLACVIVCRRVEQLGSDSLEARHLVITTFAHAQTIDRSGGRGGLEAC